MCFVSTPLRLTHVVVFFSPRVGAKPVLIDSSRIYSSLQTGVVDAAKWIGVYHDLSMKFYEVAKYYYQPAWQDPTLQLEIIINMDSWNKLSPFQKHAVSMAAEVADVGMAINSTHLLGYGICRFSASNLIPCPHISQNPFVSTQGRHADDASPQHNSYHAIGCHSGRIGEPYCCSSG